MPQLEARQNHWPENFIRGERREKYIGTLRVDQGGAGFGNGAVWAHTVYVILSGAVFQA
jgi:hypothetical protein